MKPGDIIRIKDDHHADPGMFGIVIEDYAKSANNRGKAFRIFLSSGRIKTKMVKNLEVVNEASD